MYSTAEIKNLLQNKVSPELFEELKIDSRKGVQQLLVSYEKRQQTIELAKNNFYDRLSFERQLSAEGFSAVAGIDEVGRGPLAGPVVAAAVILPADFFQPEVNDSKQVSEKKRNTLYEIILEKAVAVGIGVISEKVIDQVNIYQATKLAMIDAVKNLEVPADFLLLDAMKLDLAIPQESLIKGDARSVSIAAASIVAKVTRDSLMTAYDEEFPGYDFTHNAGYGTKNHLAGLSEFGPSPIHRRTFAPVKDYFK